MSNDERVSSGVKGEFGVGFDLERVKEAVEGTFVFIAPETQNYVLRLRPDKTEVINGTVVKTEDITAFFENFTYRTTDPEVANLIRESPAFKAGRVKELGKAKLEAKAARIEAEAKRVASDPDLARAVLAQLKQGRSVAPEVK